MWLFNLPSWLPTKEDEISSHNQKKAMLERDLPEAMVESVRLNELMFQKEEALYKTFNKEQKELWFELKDVHKRAAFQSNHVHYMQEEIRETPNRITEILHS